MNIVYSAQQMIDQKATSAVAIKMRTDAGLTQAQIARQMRVSKPQVCYLEKNKRNWTVISFGRFVDAVKKLGKK